MNNAITKPLTARKAAPRVVGEAAGGDKRAGAAGPPGHDPGGGHGKPRACDGQADDDEQEAGREHQDLPAYGCRAALHRRVVPAIATTLAVYAGLAFAAALWLREHYMTPLTTSSPSLPGSAWIISQ